MNRLKENWAYLTVGLVAILLVGTTILLQVAILSNQQSLPIPTGAQSGLGATDQEQEGQRTTSETAESTTITKTPVQVASSAIGQYNEQNDSEQNNSEQEGEEVQETRIDKAEKQERIGGIGGKVTESTEPTPTAIPPTATPEPTPSPTLLPPTKTPIPVATATSVPNLRLSTITQNATCQFFTDNSEQLLEEAFDVTIEQVQFQEAEALFADLAETSSQRQGDLTLCFIDPADRIYISQYFGYIKLLGSAYWWDETERFQIMANAAIVAPLERDQPCLYTFFQNLRFDDQPLEEIDLESKVAELQDCSVAG